MISARLGRGRPKLVSEPTSSRNSPLSNSLAEVESSGPKTNLLTWLCGLRAHSANWVVLGSFTPQPLLWDSDLSSIRVKFLLTPTLGSRDHIHPVFCNPPPFLQDYGPGSACRILLSRVPCVVTCRFLAPAVFSDVDVAFAMSRCVLPYRVHFRTPTAISVQFLASFCMSLMTTNMHLMPSCSSLMLHRE
jgi:hypothetical protein